MTVGPFANCVFFLKVKYLSRKNRKSIITHIEENGGTTSTVLNQRCSHVVIVDDDDCTLSSYQLKTIQKYQIPIVYEDFIWNCIAERRLLQVDDFTSKKSLEVAPKKERSSQEQEKSQFLGPKEWNENDAERNSLYTEHSPDPHCLQDVEVAKYAVLEKNLTDFKEVAVVELQCLLEPGAFPFHISANFGLSHGSQKERKFLQFKTSEEACESYDTYLEDLKKRDFTLKKDVPQEAIHFASETLQELLLEEARNVSSLSAEVHGFVELIWVEALGHLDHILRQPVKSISLNDVSKGEGILLQVRKALDDGATAELLSQLMSEFYRIIPHKTGIDYNVDKRLLASKQDLCQLIRDMVNVCEMNMSSPNPPSLAKYRALRCKIDHVDPGSDEFLQVEHQVLQNNHSDCPVKVLHVYRVGRMNETAAFQSKCGNIRSLLHSSSVCNFVGILSRGLLLPKMVVEDYGLERTDIGNLGSGIYFGDSISTSIKYSKPSETDGSRLLVVCDVALGNCRELYKRDCSLTDAPPGYQSVHGVRKTEDILSDFEDDEFVVYSTTQVKMRYIIKFCIGEDNVKEFHPDQSITELAESVPSMSNVQLEEISLDTNSLHEMKAGLLDTSGNPIPLRDIHIKGRIMDLIAQVVVFQTYTNQSKIPIEAKYVFPLDGTAAVCGFEAFINGKHIIGEVKEKVQAHQEYRQAVSEGHGAYLMDQDAPDIFTVSVGNLPPEATVLIKITYVAELNMQWGNVCFHVPAAVAPWQQDKALKENTQDTVEKVYIKAGGAQKGGFSLEMSVEMPYKIEHISSLTHKLKIKKTDCKAVISTFEDTSLDSDGFDLQISMCQAYLPRMWVEKHPGRESEASMLVFQPNFDTTDYVQDSSEIVICLDCSSSMEGLVLQQAKQMALLALKSIGDSHKINVIKFGSSYQEFYSFPKCNVDRSLLEKFIKSARPVMGNTDLWKPLRSLSLLAPSQGLRNILLISDGHIQNESFTFQIVKNNVKHTRLFACGVGPTANRHMLRSLSQYGAGAFEYFEAKSKYNWKEKVAVQVSRMESPGCSSVSVKWQQFNRNAPKPMQAPAQIQSLFHSERLLVYGFIPHCTQATLNAFINDQELRTMVSTTELQKTTGTLLHKLTARAIIKDYEDGILHENEAEHEMKKQMLKSLIIELSKEYSIVTQFTSFVAIEKRSSEITPQLDIPNVQELIASEDVDLLPYMDWEMSDDKEMQRSKSPSTGTSLSAESEDGSLLDEVVKEKKDSVYKAHNIENVIRHLLRGDLAISSDDDSGSSRTLTHHMPLSSAFFPPPPPPLPRGAPSHVHDSLKLKLQDSISSKAGVDMMAETDKTPEFPEEACLKKQRIQRRDTSLYRHPVSILGQLDKELHYPAPPPFSSPDFFTESLGEAWKPQPIKLKKVVKEKKDSVYKARKIESVAYLKDDLAISSDDDTGSSRTLTHHMPLSSAFFPPPPPLPGAPSHPPDSLKLKLQDNISSKVGVDMMAETDKTPEFLEVAGLKRQGIQRRVASSYRHPVSTLGQLDKELLYPAPPPFSLPGFFTKGLGKAWKPQSFPLKKVQSEPQVPLGGGGDISSSLMSTSLFGASPARPSKTDFGASATGFSFGMVSDGVRGQSHQSVVSVPCAQAPVCQGFESFRIGQEPQPSSMVQSEPQVPLGGGGDISSSLMSTNLFGASPAKPSKTVFGASTSGAEFAMASDVVHDQSHESAFSMPCEEAPEDLLAFGSFDSNEEPQPSSMDSTVGAPVGKKEVFPCFLRRVRSKLQVPLESGGDVSSSVMSTSLFGASSARPSKIVFEAREPVPQQPKPKVIQERMAQMEISLRDTEKPQSTAPFLHLRGFNLLSRRSDLPVPEAESYSPQNLGVSDHQKTSVKEHLVCHKAGMLATKSMDPKPFLPPQRVKSHVASLGRSLLALQTQTGSWHLTPELGTFLEVDVNYLCNVFLAQKGIHSLGPRGREEVLQLIATLLVLQLLQFTQVLHLITFKSLMKLDESSTESEFHWKLQRAVDWAKKTDRQYPSICSRLELGKDWDSFTRQLLRIDPMEDNSPLLKAIKLCIFNVA
ncbi:protein mono-ADP-ribosyltransferase PARP4 isoform X2 [Rhinatrema bivittatum]|uniref:protein mono-ADP-ribosyltransferase PARP4 isoform X2 n=1 Tax=Rhinatrema bivittatum TaxID=194408 RepID=UPI00112DB126|nr:protein mono-ADP-ribosyltransferase PARP4 isoform X2 [Rhinatrema bivittatum]